MANNTPVGNIDFINPLEGMSALQRNWQIARVQLSGLTTSFSASTIYGVISDGNAGNVIIADTTTNAYKFVGAGAWFFQSGMPTTYSPPGGACFALMASTSGVATVLYK